MRTHLNTTWLDRGPARAAERCGGPDRRRTRGLLAIAVGVGVGLLAIAGCGGAGATAGASGKLNVVAAEDFWGSIAAQVGGDRVAVTDIITNPAADPHDYEPTG